jgi:uncharacterized membrane-anchored protein
MSPEDWEKLVDTFGPVGKWLGEQWRWKVEEDAKDLREGNRHTFRLILSLMIFLGALVATVSYLTYDGNVSGDALLFLVGTVSGVVLAIIQRYLFEAEPEEQSIL